MAQIHNVMPFSSNPLDGISREKQSPTHCLNFIDFNLRQNTFIFKNTSLHSTKEMITMICALSVVFKILPFPKSL